VTTEQDFETVRKELAWAQSQVIRATQMRSTALDRADAALSRARRADHQRDALQAALEKARRVVIQYHEWLEKHEKFNTTPNGRRTGYIGLDHEVGQNVEGCSGCAVARQALKELEAQPALSRIETVQKLATEQVEWLQRTKREAVHQCDALQAALEELLAMAQSAKQDVWVRKGRVSSELIEHLATPSPQETGGEVTTPGERVLEALGRGYEAWLRGDIKGPTYFQQAANELERIVGQRDALKAALEEIAKADFVNNAASAVALQALKKLEEK